MKKASAINQDNWKNHWNDFVTFFRTKGIDLSTLKSINSFLRQNGLDASKIHQEIATGAGVTGKVDAIMGCLWSSIAEYRSMGDLMKSSISFLFSLSSHLESSVPFSPQLKQVFPIVTAFLNLLSTENDTITKLADKVQVDDTVKHDIAGVIEKLSTSQLHVFEMNDPENVETNTIQVMLSNIDINIGVKCIGNLKSRIESLITNYMDRPQADMCLLCINLFVRVSELRQALLLQMLTVLRLTNYSPQTATAIIKVMEKDKSRAKHLLRFLESPTVEKSVTFFAFFDFSEQEHIIRFATGLNLKLQDVRRNFDQKILCIQPCVDEKGEEYVLSRPLLPTIKALHKDKQKNDSNDVQFYFELLPGSQNRFYIRSRCRKHYVLMKRDRFCKCCEYKPGEDGEWIIIRVEREGIFYLFSPKKWPNQFIYLDKGIFESVRGLDNERKLGSVERCLCKVVPPVMNQTQCNRQVSPKVISRTKVSKQLEDILIFLKSKYIEDDDSVLRILYHLCGQSDDTIASVVRNMRQE